MAMDFFEHQDRARKRTGLLLFYFFLAVFLTVTAIDVVVYLFTGAADPDMTFGAWLYEPYWIWATLATLAVIGTGSLVRYVSLRDGGHAVAEMVHARRIRPDTADARERMLLNIVEEMAIASGTPVPTVWVMDDEPGINAFVAGFEPTQAVLVMTRGGLDAFDREQMQGVVGHEFSHILNGDMRLNIQLYAILAGILLIGKIGEFMLRNAGRTRSNSDSAKGIGALLAIGVALMVVGYAGLFCGRLIKAAIARQREYLADASSVQFTRNPDGIGEALLTISHASDGSLLHNAHAEDMSHMCFALPVHMRLAGLLATHPPLEDRIRAIDPALLARDRARAHSAKIAMAAAAAVPNGAAGFAGNGGAAVSGNSSNGSAAASIAGVSATVGNPTPSHMDYALRLRDSIPQNIRDFLHTPDGARLVIYGLIIAGTDPASEAAAVALVAAGDGEDIAMPLRGALPALRQLGTRLRLPCHDLALPSLRLLSQARRDVFLDVLDKLVRIDGRVSLREYLSLSLMRKHLAADAGTRRPVLHRNYASVAGPINTVFSLLCHAAGSSEDSREALHDRILLGFGIGKPPLVPAGELDANRLHEALVELAGLTPLLKKPLMDTCVDCVLHDGRVQVAEIELVRAIGEALDCPVPPLVG